MKINKNNLIEYFNLNKWKSETIDESFLNDFNNSFSLKNLKFENITININKFKKIKEIKYYYQKLNIENENHLIFIPMF